MAAMKGEGRNRFGAKKSHHLVKHITNPTRPTISHVSLGKAGGGGGIRFDFWFADVPHYVLRIIDLGDMRNDTTHHSRVACASILMLTSLMLVGGQAQTNEIDMCAWKTPPAQCPLVAGRVNVLRAISCAAAVPMGIPASCNPASRVWPPSSLPLSLDILVDYTTISEEFTFGFPVVNSTIVIRNSQLGGSTSARGDFLRFLLVINNVNISVVRTKVLLAYGTGISEGVAYFLVFEKQVADLTVLVNDTRALPGLSTDFSRPASALQFNGVTRSFVAVVNSEITLQGLQTVILAFSFVDKGRKESDAIYNSEFIVLNSTMSATSNYAEASVLYAAVPVFESRFVLAGSTVTATIKAASKDNFWAFVISFVEESDPFHGNFNWPRINNSALIVVGCSLSAVLPTTAGYGTSMLLLGSVVNRSLVYVSDTEMSVMARFPDCYGNNVLHARGSVNNSLVVVKRVAASLNWFKALRLLWFARLDHSTVVVDGCRFEAKHSNVGTADNINIDVLTVETTVVNGSVISWTHSSFTGPYFPTAANTKLALPQCNFAWFSNLFADSLFYMQHAKVAGMGMRVHILVLGQLRNSSVVVVDSAFDRVAASGGYIVGLGMESTPSSSAVFLKSEVILDNVTLDVLCGFNFLPCGDVRVLTAAAADTARLVIRGLEMHMELGGGSLGTTNLYGPWVINSQSRSVIAMAHSRVTVDGTGDGLLHSGFSSILGGTLVLTDVQVTSSVISRSSSFTAPQPFLSANAPLVDVVIDGVTVSPMSMFTGNGLTANSGLVVINARDMKGMVPSLGTFTPSLSALEQSVNSSSCKGLEYFTTTERESCTTTSCKLVPNAQAATASGEETFFSSQALQHWTLRGGLFEGLYTNWVRTDASALIVASAVHRHRRTPTAARTQTIFVSKTLSAPDEHARPSQTLAHLIQTLTVALDAPTPTTAVDVTTTATAATSPFTLVPSSTSTATARPPVTTSGKAPLGPPATNATTTASKSFVTTSTAPTAVPVLSAVELLPPAAISPEEKSTASATYTAASTSAAAAGLLSSPADAQMMARVYSAFRLTQCGSRVVNASSVSNGTLAAVETDMSFPRSLLPFLRLSGSVMLGTVVANFSCCLIVTVGLLLVAKIRGRALSTWPDRFAAARFPAVPLTLCLLQLEGSVFASVMTGMSDATVAGSPPVVISRAVIFVAVLGVGSIMAGVTIITVRCQLVFVPEPEHIVKGRSFLARWLLMSHGHWVEPPPTATPELPTTAPLGTSVDGSHRPLLSIPEVASNANRPIGEPAKFLPSEVGRHADHPRYLKMFGPAVHGYREGPTFAGSLARYGAIFDVTFTVASVIVEAWGTSRCGARGPTIANVLVTGVTLMYMAAVRPSPSFYKAFFAICMSICSFVIAVCVFQMQAAAFTDLPTRQRWAARALSSTLVASAFALLSTAFTVLEMIIVRVESKRVVARATESRARQADEATAVAMLTLAPASATVQATSVVVGQAMTPAFSKKSAAVNANPLVFANATTTPS